MKSRLGISMFAASLAFACVAEDAGIIADPPSDKTHATDHVQVLSGNIISDIQIVDLGTLPGGMNSTAQDINDAGDIVGWSGTTSGQTHGFILIGSVKTDLGTLPGGNLSRAWGINSLRQVVGTASNSVGVTHGFVWQGGVMRDLGAYPPEDPIGSSSNAFAINNAGLIAGNVDLAGVVWNLAGVPNFPPFPPFAAVTQPGAFQPARSHDINNSGQVVGTLLAAEQAFRWQSGTLVTFPVMGIINWGNGINGLGQAVGRVTLVPSLRTHAVFWPNLSSVLDLGTLGGENSEAFEINNDGLIVGQSQTATGDTVAFVWRQDLGMHSLGTLGGSASRAFAINASGQIVGESTTSTGAVHAALWTIKFATVMPVDVKPGSVPNSVNPRSHGVIPVAILSNNVFDATSVNPLSVRFGPGKASEAHGLVHVEDVNGDGKPDLMLHFKTDDAGIQCGDSNVILTGQTFGGTALQGSDSIKTVGCK